MKCLLNRSTAALLAVLLLAVPAIAVQAAPQAGRNDHGAAAAVSRWDGVASLWQHLLDGLAAVFAADSPSPPPPSNNGESGSGFDPDGSHLVVPDPGSTPDPPSDPLL